jgi:hypothetical protein
MIFSEACCAVLKHCLESGDERVFHRAAGDTGPLMVRTMTSSYETNAGREQQFHEQAVLYCPFCGKQLQTAVDVERYFKGD